MSFHSVEYLLLFCAVFVAHRVCPSSYRAPVLLAGSFVFYWLLGTPHLPAALLGVGLLSHFLALRIGAAKDARRRRALFWLAVTANLLVLVALKYLPFLATNANAVLGVATPHLRLPAVSALVSVGASFWVLQAIAYLTDVYLGDEPEPDASRLLAYLAFFPKLLQGPIERGGDLLPQVRQPPVAQYAELRSGLILFAWGLLKKVVLADRLGLIVDPIYDDVRGTSGAACLLATYCFAFQIYLDFSGYTDMALGSARVLGIRLTRNFDNPLWATSVPDFWRRWHISFSRWLMEYVYHPLQLHWRRLGLWGVVLALMATFLVSGIWHGASWSFIAWGALHGSYLVASAVYRHVSRRPAIAAPTRWSWDWPKRLLTFHLVLLGWVFFRALSLGDALHILGLIAREGWHGRALLTQLSAVPSHDLAVLALALPAALIIDRAGGGDWLATTLAKRSFVVRWATYYLLACATYMFGTFGVSKFIYFAF